MRAKRGVRTLPGRDTGRIRAKRGVRTLPCRRQRQEPDLVLGPGVWHYGPVA